MAKEASASKYLLLDSVRVIYDDKTDSVHLTAKDKDFEKGDSFHVVLSKDTSTERTLRKLLYKYHLISQDVVQTFPRSVSINSRDSLDTDSLHIPLGVYRNGEECVWEVENLFVKGKTGSGKSSIGRVIAYHTDRFSHDWDLYGIDMKFQFSSRSIHFKKVAKDLESAEELLDSLTDELKLRYERMETEGVNSYRDLLDKPKTIMLLVEDFHVLTAEANPKSMSRFEYLKHEFNRELALQHLADISRLGRGVGIHMALFSHDDIDSNLTELRRNITSNVSFRTSSHGRGILNDGKTKQEFQAYYVP